MATHSSQSITLFYCYARKDRALRDELDTHLAGLRRSGLVTSWYDGEIIAGTSWEEEIENRLNTSDVILLLVSPDFIGSDYCYSKEMKRAMERHRAKEARVVPILLRPVDWTGTPFSQLQMIPTDARPITLWDDRDAAFADIAKHIRRVVADLIEQRNRHNRKYLEEADTTSNSTSLPNPLFTSMSQQSLTQQQHPKFSVLKRLATRRNFLIALASVALGGGAITWQWIRSSAAIPVGATLHLLRGHTDQIWSVAWSRDSSLLASAGADGLVKVWNAHTGKWLFDYRGHFPFMVWHVDWSREKYIASSDEGSRVQIWDGTNGSYVTTFHGLGRGIIGAAWSPNNRYLAAGGRDNIVWVWDTQTKQAITQYHDHTSYINALCWSPDGTQLASAGGDRVVYIWNAFTGKRSLIYPLHQSAIWTLSWSHSGQYIASGSAGESDSVVRVWQAGTGETLYVYRGHAGSLHAAAWSPHDRYIASGSNDHTIHIWEPLTGQRHLIYKDHTEAVLSVGWSPDGAYIASAGADRVVRIWNAPELSL